MTTPAKGHAAPLIVTIITRGDDLEHHVPAGFHLADQIFEEAGLQDPISAAHSEMLAKKLRIALRALKREFDGQIIFRIVNPWTPAGLWFSFRYRVRNFPCVLMKGRPYSLDTPVNELIEIVRQVLNIERLPSPSDS